MAKGRRHVDPLRVLAAQLSGAEERLEAARRGYGPAGPVVEVEQVVEDLRERRRQMIVDAVGRVPVEVLAARLRITVAEVEAARNPRPRSER